MKSSEFSRCFTNRALARRKTSAASGEGSPSRAPWRSSMAAACWPKAPAPARARLLLSVSRSKPFPLRLIFIQPALFHRPSPWTAPSCVQAHPARGRLLRYARSPSTPLSTSRMPGYDCSSGEEALDLTRHELPEIIISDIGLPGISGLELNDPPAHPPRIQGDHHHRP